MKQALVNRGKGEERYAVSILATSLIKAIVSGEIFGCLESVFDVCFQKKKSKQKFFTKEARVL